MNLKETRERILDIMNFLSDGECTKFGYVYKGHPGFYFFHSKEEMMREMDSLLANKTQFDKYDICYIVRRLIAFLLSKYDSHTKVFFENDPKVPITFKMIEENVYIINMTNEIENVVGGKLLSINGVDVKEIISEMKKTTCYSTEGYLHFRITTDLTYLETLKTLPSIDNKSKKFDYLIDYNGELKHLIFDEDNMNYEYQYTKENYVYKIINDALVITYSKCEDFEKMKQFVKEIETISKKHKINKFIIDLRDNMGGDSLVINPLLDFLFNNKDNKIVTLVNEYTFSSGSHNFITLKQLGSYSIGTETSTSINNFGNNTRRKYYEDIDLTITGSAIYFYKNKDLTEERAFNSKTDFETFFKDNKPLLEPIIILPDEIVDISVADMINGIDTQLNAALKHLDSTN